MDSSLETVRAALTEGATADQRAAGVVACRAILTALGAAPGQPLDVGAAAPSGPHVPGVAFDHVLELAIAKLRSMLPAEQAAGSPPGEAPLPIRMFKRTP